METWRWGAALAGTGIILLVLAQAALPMPPDEGAFATRLAEDGPRPAAGLRVALGAPSLVAYDKEADATLAVFAACDGEPCGPAFRFFGDARERLASGASVAVATSPGEVGLVQAADATPGDPFAVRVGGVFTLLPLWAVLGPHVAALSLLLVGLSLLPQRPWQVAALLAACGVGGAALGLAATRGSDVALLAAGTALAPAALLGFGVTAAVVLAAPAVRGR